MGKIILIAAMCFSINKTFSQNMKLTEATEQSWFGGECCSYGVKYVLTLESGDTTAILALDTAWIGNKYFTNDKQQKIPMERIVVNGKANYKLYPEESWSGRNEGLDMVIEKRKGACPYKGKATVVYQVKGKKKISSIGEIIVLAPLAYP